MLEARINLSAQLQTFLTSPKVVRNDGIHDFKVDIRRFMSESNVYSIKRVAQVFKDIVLHVDEALEALLGRQRLAVSTQNDHRSSARVITRSRSFNCMLPEHSCTCCSTSESSQP